MVDEDKMAAAVRAGCEWANEHIARRGVRAVRSTCGYPYCGCQVVPGQIKAAVRGLLATAGDDLGFNPPIMAVPRDTGGQTGTGRPGRDD